MEKRFPLSPRWIPWLFCGGIVLLNLVLKAWQAGSSSLYLDEAASIYAGQMNYPDFVSFLRGDESPPFYYWLLRAWMTLVGDDLGMLRSLSAGLSALAAGGVFWVGKRFFSSYVGLLGALLFTFSNLQFTYAQEVRCFALVGFLGVISAYFFLGLLFHKRKSDLYGLMAANVMLAGTHYATVAFLVAQGLIALAFLLIDRRRVLRYALSQVPTLLFSLVYILGDVSDRKINNISTWFEAPDGKVLLQMMAAFSGYTPIGAVMLCLIVAAGGYLVARIWGKAGNENTGLALVLLALPVLGLLVAWLVSQWMPFFMAKYLSYLGIGWLLAVAVALQVLPMGKVARLGLGLGLLVWSLLLFKAEKPVSEDWRRAALVAKALKQDGGLVITPTYQLKTFAYYYDREAFRDYQNLARRMEAQKISSVNQVEENFPGLQEYKRCLLLQSHVAVTDPQRKSRQRFEAQLIRKASVVYQGIEITLFEGQKQGL